MKYEPADGYWYAIKTKVTGVWSMGTFGNMIPSLDIAKYIILGPFCSSKATEQRVNLLKSREVSHG